MYSPMTPVSQPSTMYTRAVAPAPAATTVPASASPTGVASPTPIAAQGSFGNVLSGVFSAIGSLLSGIFNFFKRLFSGGTPAAAPAAAAVPGQVATPAVPAPITPTVPAPVTPTAGTPATASGLTADQATLCQQQGILATPANYQAFMTAAQSIEQQNALGPGSTDTQSITELQQVLAGWGYQVAVNGQFDQATTNAVLQFKRDNHLYASYVMADGSPAVNPFIDAATKQAMIAKLQTQPATTTATAATPTTSAVATPAPISVSVNGAPTTGVAPATPPTPVAVPVSGTPAPTPVSAPTPVTASTGLTADQLATCQQQGIQATPANYQAFMSEAQSLEQQNALGPGSTDSASITELQQVLAGWGYPVAVTGQFDQATTNAVLAFKKANGLYASYVLADGTPAYHPFIDAATKQAMIAKLQTQPVAASTPTTSAVATPSPVNVSVASPVATPIPVTSSVATPTPVNVSVASPIAAPAPVTASVGVPTPVSVPVAAPVAAPAPVVSAVGAPSPVTVSVAAPVAAPAPVTSSVAAPMPVVVSVNGKPGVAPVAMPTPVTSSVKAGPTPIVVSVNH